MDLYDIYNAFSTALRSIFKENQKEIYVLETRYVPVLALKPKLFLSKLPATAEIKTHTGPGRLPSTSLHSHHSLLVL
jgi:hypothetical protein